MKMHKLEVYVFDFDDAGVNNAIAEIEQNRLFMRVKHSDTTDIGSWDDNHLLNMSTTSVQTFREYFTTK